MPFDIPSGADVRRDDDGVLRRATHTGTAFRPADQSETSPQAIAIAYLREVAEQYDVPADALDELGTPLAGDLVDEGMRLAFAEQKRTRGVVTVSFAQGLFGLPIWEAGFSVTLRGDPLGVVSSRSSIHRDADAEPPDPDAPFMPEQLDEGDLREALHIQREAFEVNDLGLRVYRYDPEDRFHPEASPPNQDDGGGVGDPDDDLDFDDPTHGGRGRERSGDEAGEARSDEAGGGGREPGRTGGPPVLPLPPVPEGVEPGRHYVVTEVLFSTPVPGSNSDE